MKSPVPSIECLPLETNILEWHYCIEGPSDSLYAGGTYHGKLVFPSEYPLKPPSIYMNTPSGRFSPGKSLCLSMSDFHPETWNPMWSVSTILTGLFSFMLDTQATLGSVESTRSQKKTYAQQSMAHNMRDKEFRTLFKAKVEIYQKMVKEEAERLEEAEKRRQSEERVGEGSGSAGSTTSTTTKLNHRGGTASNRNNAKDRNNHANRNANILNNANIQRDGELWKAKAIELAMMCFAACVILGLGVQMLL
jgi:ubiquitin-conjugating enzyme E2 J2